MNAKEKMQAAANYLHHLSMRYAGACLELVQGKPVGMIPKGYPGLREFRDLADLILFTRAEINALTKLLLDAEVVTADQVTTAFAEEYRWFANVKAKQLGVGISDLGLVYKVGGDQ